MDKQGNLFLNQQKNSCELTGTENEFLRSFSEKEIDEVPRKVSLSEYLSSPEFQRQRKIEIGAGAAVGF